MKTPPAPTPFRHAIEEGLVAKGGLFQVGIRGPFGSAGDAELSARHRSRILAVEEIDDRGLALLAAR